MRLKHKSWCFRHDSTVSFVGQVFNTPYELLQVDVRSNLLLTAVTSKLVS